MKISILLPYKENFSSKYAGAVSLFVKDTSLNSKYKKSIYVYGNMNYSKPFLKNYVNIKLDKKILLKVDPDSSDEDYSKIINIVQKNKIDGLIVTNTSISRPKVLKSYHKNQSGGLSGAPIKRQSNKVLRFMSKETQGELMLIGVGGIESAHDIYEKIKIGASLVQIYSALTYNNLGFINKMNRELSTFLRNDGFSNIKEAVGIEMK